MTRTAPSRGRSRVLGPPIALALTGFLAAACGRIGYEPREQAVADAAVYGPDGGCVPGSWLPPTELAFEGELNVSFSRGPWPSTDRLTLYFSMELWGGSESIYYATRTDPESSSFGAPARIDTVSSDWAEGTPTLSVDGKTIYFFAETGQGGYGTRDIYYATRSSDWPSEPFGMRAILPNVNDAGGDETPKLTPNGQTLVFSSTRPGSSGMDLYIAERGSSSDDFATVRRLDELATAGSETGGSLTPNDMTLFYASDRAGTIGNLDLWVTSRPDKASAFEAPTNITPLNSTADEFDVAISNDGMEIFFVSSRSGAKRLWHSLRRCSP